MFQADGRANAETLPHSLAPQEGWCAESSVSEREGTRIDCRVTGSDKTRGDP